MKSIKYALVAVLLSGGLAACNSPEPAAPAADAAPAAAEPAAVEPAAPAGEPMASEPAAPDAAATPATDAPPADAADGTDDTPHSGGDKVGTAPAPAAPPSN